MVKRFLISFLIVIIAGAALPFTHKKAAEQIMIDIQPLGDIPKQKVDYVFERLKKIYSNLSLKKAIPLPKIAFYEPRRRYRADSLVHFLNRKTPAGHVTIGLTIKDISTTKEPVKDYGIMGLGLCPGNSCVASTFRLSKTNTDEQLFKTAIHELGHTQGLPHCPVQTCFMRDAEGKNRTDEEKEFCPKCKSHLQSKGWVLN
jgi:archaemetzincin